jgi:glycerol-3-phosphate O-acyltransferase/dihydroxyacetone phosphate acyltransferase
VDWPYAGPMSTSASTLRSSADRLVQTLGRLVIKAWFRSVEAHGMDQISSDRPILVCANHANGFVDPVLLAATSPRPVRFLAKSTLWKVPGVGPLLDLAGVLPVYRRQDDSETSDNARSFAACDAELAVDGAIGIFPEGTVNDTLKLLPLRTGAARIALGARAAGVDALRIVPVGLLYEDKATPRTRVLVRARDPIDLDDVWPDLVRGGGSGDADDHVAVDRLTALITEALTDAYVSYDDESELHRLEQAARIALRPPGADPSHLVPMARLEPVARRLGALPPERLQPVLAEADAYTAQLELLGLTDRDVVPGNTLPRLQQRLNRSATATAVLAPLATVGAGVNLPPLAVVRLVSRRPMARISRGNILMLSSIVAFPLTWLAWGLLARRRLRHPWRAVLVAGPAGGYAALACWEQLDRVRRAKLQWRRVRRSTDLLDGLREERAAVVQAVDDALGASARSVSSSVGPGPGPRPTEAEAPGPPVRP